MRYESRDDCSEKRRDCWMNKRMKVEEDRMIDVAWEGSMNLKKVPVGAGCKSGKRISLETGVHMFLQSRPYQWVLSIGPSTLVMRL